MWGGGFLKISVADIVISFLSLILQLGIKLQIIANTKTIKKHYNRYTEKLQMPQGQGYVYCILYTY